MFWKGRRERGEGSRDDVGSRRGEVGGGGEEGVGTMWGSRRGRQRGEAGEGGER